MSLNLINFMVYFRKKKFMAALEPRLLAFLGRASSQGVQRLLPSLISTKNAINTPRETLCFDIPLDITLNIQSSSIADRSPSLQEFMHIQNSLAPANGRVASHARTPASLLKCRHFNSHASVWTSGRTKYRIIAMSESKS